jgi:hypothetical protein
MPTHETKPSIPEKISDEKWTKLRQLSGLPEGARSEVEDIVRFMHGKPSLKNPLATELQVSRKNLREAIKALDGTLKPLDALIKCGAHFAFHPLESGPDNQASAIGVKNKVVQLRSTIADIKSDLEYSEKRMKHARPGSPRRHLPIAIELLNELLIERTGRPLDQKNRRNGGIDLTEFARQVLQEAIPSLKIDKIQYLIKREQSAKATGRKRRKSRGPRT